MSESTTELYRRTTEQIASVPLSQLLPSILTLARRLNDSNLENWVRLEMDGYLKDNPAMNEDIVVPEYRAIAGRRSDEFGRPFVINDSRFHFINEERIRSGVAELEHLAKDNKMLTIHTPEANRIIREEFRVEVTRFTFHPSSISGVLSNIRSKLLDWLDEIEPDIDQLITRNQEANIRESAVKVK